MMLLKVPSKKFINLIRLLSDFLLVTFGCISVIFILYNRLRYRLPKTLPIELSPENFTMYLILISTITFMLFFNFYSLINKETAKPKNIYLNLLVEIYHRSIDKFFNTVEYISSYFLKKTIKDFCAEIFERFCPSITNYKIYVFYIEILPRVVILCFFITDIYILKKIHYFYISLLLFCIPLLTRCILYIIQRIFNDALENLNNKLDIYMEECNINNDLLPPMSIKYYFEQKILYILEKRKNPINYTINISFEHMKELYKILEITSNQEINSKEIIKFYENIIDNKLLPLAFFYNKYNDIKQLFLPKINIMLFGTYFIGWSYVLYTSYKIFPENYFIFLKNITDIEEPFSGIFL